MSKTVKKLLKMTEEPNPDLVKIAKLHDKLEKESAAKFTPDQRIKATLKLIKSANDFSDMETKIKEVAKRYLKNK